jgi:sec-independent protein translocase protein TatA
MPSIGWPELLIVGVVVMLIFGPKRLPEVGRSLGGAIREFKAGTSGKLEEKRLENK